MTPARLGGTLAALALLGACITSAPTPSETTTATILPTVSAVTPAPSPTVPPTTVLLPGTFSSVRFPTRSDLPYFGGGLLMDGRYAATALTDGHSAYQYTLFDMSTGTVRGIDTPSGSLGGAVGLDAGRIALSLESRTSAGEVFDYLIEDAATKARTSVDHSDAPGIFHGEGAPAQPDPGFVLSGERVAFNHLFVQDGALWVDLKVGAIGATPSTVIRTRDQAAPVALTETTLVYVVKSRTGAETQLRLYDVATRRDSLVMRGLFFFSAALGGGRLLYYARPFDATPGRAVLRDLATGLERELAIGACADPSLNDRYAAITCGAQTPSTSVTVFDLASGQPVEIARSSDRLGGARLLPGAIWWVRFVGTPAAQTFYIETLRY